MTANPSPWPFEDVVDPKSPHCLVSTGRTELCEPGVVLEDGVGSNFPEFRPVGPAMFEAQGAIVAWVPDADRAVDALGRR